MAETHRSPGWYPDPAGLPGERWWNGVDWSESRRGMDGIASAARSNITPSVGTRPVVYSALNPAPQSASDVSRSAALRTGVSANPMAMTAIIAAFVSVFLNFLLIPSVIAIIYGVRALGRARQLAAAGQPGTARTVALIAIGIALVTAAWNIVLFFVAFTT